MSDEIEQMYEVFRDLLDSGTPEEAVKKLEVLRIDQDTIQRIIEMHEQHTIRIKELEEPRSVVLDNRDTWYTVLVRRTSAGRRWWNGCGRPGGRRTIP